MPRARAGTSSEDINVHVARAKEVQKIHALVFTSILYTQEYQGILDAPSGAFRSYSPPHLSNTFNGMLGIVIIPRNAIIVEKREKLITVLFEPFLVTYCHLSPICPPLESPKEAFNRLLVLAEMPRLQPESINGFDHGLD